MSGDSPELAWDYTEAAHAYGKRPGYAPAAIDAIIEIARLAPGALVADVAHELRTPIAVLQAGHEALLDGVADFLPSPYDVDNFALDISTKDETKIKMESDASKPFVGYAFKLEEGRFGQLTYLRVYQGKVEKGKPIYNMSTKKKHNVGRLVRMHANEMGDITSAEAGDIVALFGIDCATGTTFTDGTLEVNMTSMHVPNAVIDLVIEAKNRDHLANLSKALNRFTKEDPTLRVARDEESAETILSGMGELHLEIYIERMKREYNCEVIAGKPQVAFRETITASVPAAGAAASTIAAPESGLTAFALPLQLRVVTEVLLP